MAAGPRTAGAAVLLATLVLAPVAHGQLSWSGPVTIDSGANNQLGWVACPSQSQCTAVDQAEREITFNPAEPGTPAPVAIDNAGNLNGLACPSVSQCTVVDTAAREVTFKPTDPGTPTPMAIDNNALLGPACPSVNQCTAVDSMAYELTFDPSNPGSPTPKLIFGRGDVVNVLACPTTSQCTAVDAGGYEVTFNPGNPGTPTPVSIDSGQFVGVNALACPSASQCTAVDNMGREVTFDPTSPGAPTPTAIDHTGLTGIACPSTTECLAVDNQGTVLEGNPTSSAAWTAQQLAAGTRLDAIACPSTTECVAVDNQGHMYAALGGSGGGSGGSTSDNGAGAPTPTCADHSITFGPFTAETTCFKRVGLKFTTSGRVRLNGLDISLNGSAQIEIDTLSETIKATGPVTIRAGSIELYSGKLDLDLKKNLSLHVARSAKVKGLPLTGSFSLKPQTGGMGIKATARIGASKGVHVTGTVKMLVTNELGLQLNEMKVQIAQLPIKQLLIQSAYLEYQRTASGGDEWTGKVTAQLPAKLPTVEGELVLLDGSLKSVAATISNINKPIGEVVFLQSLGLKLVFIPNFDVTGSVGLSAGPKLPLLNKAGLSLNASLEADFGTPVVLTAKGTLELAGQVQLANATAVWTVPDKFTFNGQASFKLGGVGVSASGNGLADRKGFYFHGNAQVALPGHATANGFAYMSEKGLTACALISAGPASALVGFGYPWGGKLQLWGESCGALAFKSAAAASASRAASGTQPHAVAASSTFHVPAGQSQTIFQATGQGAAPKFSLRSPSGQVIAEASSSSAGAIGSGGYAYLPDPGTDTEAIVVVKPQKGTWTLSAQPGSAPIIAAADALSAPKPAVHMTLRRRGRFELLHWRASSAPGQRLEFTEVGPDVAVPLLVTGKASGSLRFRAAPDPRGGQRLVRVTVERGGLPVAILTGARFRQRATPPPRPPRRVTLRRSGRRLTIRWTRSAGAARYLVHLTDSAGLSLYFERPKRLVSSSAVSFPARVTVTVAPISPAGQMGRAHRVRARYR